MSEALSREEFIEQELASGKYTNRQELMDEAVRVMQAYKLTVDELAGELRGPVERLKSGQPAKKIDPEELIAEETSRYHSYKNGA